MKLDLRLGGVLLILGVTTTGACGGGSCDHARANDIQQQILTAWQQDQAKFPSGVAPCALPSNATDVLGAARVKSYKDDCASYQDALSGC